MSVMPDPEAPDAADPDDTEPYDPAAPDDEPAPEPEPEPQPQADDSRFPKPGAHAAPPPYTHDPRDMPLGSR
jgi:hypothetical protein